MATKILALDLADPLPASVDDAEQYDRIWVVVFHADLPLGRVLIENGRTPVPRFQLRSEIARQLSESLPADLDPDEVGNSLPRPPALLPELSTTDARPQFMSVIVCTRDRPVMLQRCLESLRAMEPGPHQVELIVVDNNPDSGQTGPVVARFERVRSVAERCPGEPYARNAGLASATGEIVAYVDDDVVVPARWPERILAPFADPRIACVSGLVLPLSLEARSQELYEEAGGLGRGYTARLHGPDFFHGPVRRPVPTWELGGTANVAVRRDVLAEIGGFDETLGAGVPGGVGTDIYMLYQVLKRGYYCYYNPAAYVWHEHRQDLPALSRQLSDYARGQVSYQLRTLVTDGDGRALWQLLHHLPRWYVGRVLRSVRGESQFPLSVIAAELRSFCTGPYAFYVSNRTRARMARSRRDHGKFA